MLPKYLFMRWEAIPTNVSNLVEYRLLEDNQLKLTLKYNALQRTARMHTNDTQRWFFLHQQPGILRSRTVFTNEYGVEVGKLSADKWYGNTYTVELEDKRYQIAFRNNPLAELVVYTKSADQALLTCGLNITDGRPGLDFSNENNETSSLLLALCWYLFLPLAKEKGVAFAVTA